MWLVAQIPRLREDSQPSARIRDPKSHTPRSVSPPLPTATALHISDLGHPTAPVTHSSNRGLLTGTAPLSVSLGLHLALVHLSARHESLTGASLSSVAPRAPADASLLASSSLPTTAVHLQEGLSPTAAVCHQHLLQVPITTAPHHVALSPSIAVAVLRIPLQAALGDVVPSAG